MEPIVSTENVNCPVVAPMTRDTIMSVATEIVHSRLPAGSHMREMRFSGLYPEFHNSYPKLFDMCCNASSDNESGRALMCMLPFLLDRLDDLDAQRSDLDNANAAVVSHLNSVYVEPIIGPAPSNK